MGRQKSFLTAEDKDFIEWMNSISFVDEEGNVLQDDFPAEDLDPEDDPDPDGDKAIASMVGFMADTMLKVKPRCRKPKRHRARSEGRRARGDRV
jgi:hypothetical protein